MFNTKDIIELEKKWLKYKIKQKSKVYIFILVISILAFIFYTIYNSQQKDIYTQTTTKNINPIKQTKPLVIENNNNSKKNTNTISVVKKSIPSENNVSISPKVVKEKIISKPYYFKLKSTEQGSELFSSNGFLTLNIEHNIEKQEDTEKIVKQIIQPIRETQISTNNKEVKKQKTKISIDMKEIDTIAYLKDKYYSTSSIVFALMLAEEYYYEKKYKQALKWALTANDIDSQNTKSWYWFAKSKVKLGKIEDATRALKAYLANNNSKRLSTLLHKIELGDTDD